QTLSCSNGNFTGYAQVTKIISSSGFFRPVLTSMAVTKYKIVRSNEQKGGDKANVNLLVSYWNGKKHVDVKSKSSDSMKQDSEWHNIDLAASTLPSYEGQVTADVQFIFDKSGPDPKCKISLGPY
ncbi:hypothetical protein, partial [Serratia marcescens]|uniref:hypothetical protein n=1 Tax=Serratia marcescens TaxID=615 RepID=UPI001CA34FE2